MHSFGPNFGEFPPNRQIFPVQKWIPYDSKRKGFTYQIFQKSTIFEDFKHFPLHDVASGIHLMENLSVFSLTPSHSEETDV